ncbi:ATP-utilizing chromatin assembly and remodelling N-terminal-domain-containing protein, partial [Lipomyces oligophaga]|uniref:ATP-utilizing chromatin assembly and remodelling N-terminal-domain-containing protein n=1 Tax=Lipomyces oligophaga TaxID=45792 RepID=UPI0034CE4EFA
VLFKRKIVRPLPAPDAENLSPTIGVWYIQRTGEYFLDYDAYLRRLDFYNQHRFVCELTGHSNMSYWDALDSEISGSRSVDSLFPESLKEPVLRRLQFSTTPRLDHLVDEVYETFKSDFYPGEHAFALIHNDKLEVVIREKAQFNAILLPNGQARPAYAKYRVEMLGHGRDGQEDVVDGSQLSRDRKRFSKSMLRTFIKNASSRDPWAGAPWVVKPKYAHLYRIDTALPPHLRYNSSKSALPSSKPDKLILDKKRELKLQRKQEKQRLQLERKQQHLKQQQEAQQNRERERQLQAATNKRPVSFEDLDLIPLLDPPSTRPHFKIESMFPQSCISSLLEVWTFLNFFHEPLTIDPFSFDDLLGCLLHPYIDEHPCELFVEIHCCLLKLIVDRDSPELVIDLPTNFQAKEGSNPAESTENSIEVSEGEETDNQDEGQDDDDDDDDDYEDEEASNRLKEMTRWREGGWKERLQRCLFVGGSMELIIINILNTISYVDKWAKMCSRIVDFVAPLDMPATLETARSRYQQLSSVDKLQVLQILVELVRDCSVVRDHIEYCMEESTRIRRERLDTHKEHKALLEHIRALDEERETYLPAKVDDTQDAEEEPDQIKLRSTKVPPTRDEVDAQLLKTNADYKKLVSSLETAHKKVEKCHVALRQAEIDLRGIDCQRMRPLGRDRYYNRYYWFENNGLPTDLGPKGYLMGRLWIQGPSEEDLKVFVENGMAAYGEMTLDSRKKLEIPDQGNQFNGSDDWGYIDQVEVLDELLAWLASKGIREAKLKKDIEIRRTRIESPIRARCLNLAPMTTTELSTKSQTPASTPTPTSTPRDTPAPEDEPRRTNRQRQRKRNIQEPNQNETELGKGNGFQFLSWQNQAARTELNGKTHYEAGYKKSGDFLANKAISFASTSLASIA